MSQWLEHSLPINVQQVQFPDSALCGLSLLVLYSALRGFSPGTPVFPSPQKPTFDLIALIVNVSLQCPQLALQR